MSRICRDCPFRPRTFLPLSAVDAARLIDFVEGGHTAICHETLGGCERACGGAVSFRKRGAGVFVSERAMSQAHRRSRRPIGGQLWGIS